MIFLAKVNTKLKFMWCLLFQSESKCMPFTYIVSPLLPPRQNNTFLLFVFNLSVKCFKVIP